MMCTSDKENFNSGLRNESNPLRKTRKAECWYVSKNAIANSF